MTHAHPPDGFASSTAEANGTRLHYVRGGDGPPVVLLHGFPQDWFEWRHVMTRLADAFDVVAVDQRGVGGSAPEAGGYDAHTMAQDVHALASALQLDRPYVAGHDIGGWTAYALARTHGDDLRGTMVLEALIPGIEALELVPDDIQMWHAPFHMVPGLPEALVDGREATYFRYFFDDGTAGDGVIGDAETEHYAAAYSGRLNAAFETYRAYAANAEANGADRGPVATPLTLVGGEQVFGPALASLPDRLRDEFGWTDVRAEILPGARHYVVEEFPDAVAELIRTAAAR